MQFKQIQWFFPLAVTAHNLEEAIWLPQWSQNVGSWHAPVGAVEFRFAVIVLTFLAYLAAFMSYKQGRESLGAYFLTGYATAMLLNVFFPHLAGTLVTGSYAPGLATALLLNLPVTFFLIRSAFREAYVSRKKYVISAVIVVAGLMASIPLLFAMGRYL